eukprot:GDKJ01019203.1.p1 GENE.GDKJ01019203.1~~GDKJ01019203.1.p1  ORF type:complete len:191 (-),score=26.25 GDKJ01019203.1:67-639(-)
MYDSTYENLTSDSKIAGITKNVAVSQFLEIRSPLYGNRYIDDRSIDCVHRVDEDPRQIFNGRAYPKNTGFSGYHFPRRTLMDPSGFKEFDRSSSFLDSGVLPRSAPNRLTLRAATAQQQKEILRKSADVQSSMKCDYANRNSHHASLKPWAVLQQPRSPAGTKYNQGISNISPKHHGLSPGFTGFKQSFV